MADQTNIEWCDSTFNPWMGCTRVSPACDHCYAAVSTPARTLGITWGPGEDRRRTSPANWKQPLVWERQAAEFQHLHGRRRRVFCASLADVFDNEVPVQWRRDLFDLIEATPSLDWLLLTKRIGNARKLYGTAYLDSARAWPANVWLGATICNQAEAERDIPKLLATPAAVRFLSVEPMLGPIQLRGRDDGGTLWIGGQRGCGGTHQHHGDPGGHDHGDSSAWVIGDPRQAHHHHDNRCRPGIDWVICGGESGPHARPMHPDWARSLRDQCASAGVPFLFKQWGEWLPDFDATALGSESTPLHRFDDGRYMIRVGKKAADRLLDGARHDEFPHPTHWSHP